MSKLGNRNLSLHEILREHNTLILLARASELGRRGHLLEAEALLTPSQSLPSDWRALDLLARIHVRQGRYADAMKRWRDATRRSTGLSFEREAAALEEFVERQAKRQKLYLVIVAICIGIIAAFLFL